MKLYIVLRDVNQNIALLKLNDEYYLPSCHAVNDKDNKLTLCDYLKKEYGLKARKEYFELKIEDKDLYYYCYEPYTLEEFKRNQDKITWIKENVLKDVLTKLNTSNSNKLIEVLTKILKSNFSFSKSEREDLSSKMKEAYDNNDMLAFNYYSEIAKSKLTNKNNQSEINKRYQEQLRKLKEQEEKRKKELEYENHIKELNNTDLIYLTKKEAKLIGKYDEWIEIINKAFRLQHLIPINPNGSNICLFDAEMKLQGKDDITPNVIYELATRYKDSSYEEAKENLQNMLKIQNKNVKNKY